jgi:large subunit ribosomal protein L28
MSGNKVSHSNRKTRRRFLPNLKELSFRSDTLGVDLKLKIATSTLRTINKFGNLDSFLVNYSYAKLTAKGQKLRTQIKKKLIKLEKLDEIKIVKEQKVKHLSARAKRVAAAAE